MTEPIFWIVVGYFVCAYVILTTKGTERYEGFDLIEWFKRPH